MRICCAPSQLAIQTSVSLLSAAVSTLVTVYATHFPSGEICRSRTSWKACMSSILISRCEVWANSKGRHRKTSKTRILGAVGMENQCSREVQTCCKRIDLGAENV